MVVFPEEAWYYTMAKPKKKAHPRWQAKHNDGHSFIRGRGEHPFAQL